MLNTRVLFANLDSSDYMPPRQQWAQPTPLTQNGEPSNVSSSLYTSSNALPLPPIAASPPMGGPNRARGDSGSYYEDVDPRFAVEEHSPPPNVPSALTPGGMPPGAISRGIPGGFPGTPGPGHGPQGYSGQRMQSPSLPPQNTEYLHPSYLHAQGAGSNTGGAGANDLSPRSDRQILATDSITPLGSSQEDLPEGARSPGQGSERASEASHFTSISQRPVNPNWRPVGNHPGASMMGSTASGMQRRREDVILTANPDFAIPGIGRGGARGGRAARGSVPPSTGLTPGGRYPTEF